MPKELLMPTWFFGMDVIFQLAFALVTIGVAFYAFKIHKLTGQKQSKLLGISFLFFAIGYVVQSFFNFAILSTLAQEICTLAQIENIRTFEVFGTYFYMVFSLIGVVTLLYMTLKCGDKRIYSIILFTSLISLFLSLNPGYLFYALSTLFFAFIVHYYAKNYREHKKPMTFIILLSFVFLLFSRIHYIFGADMAGFYILGNFLELGAYILIFINLLLVNKK